ncbi:hypothetical protein GPECTOR_2g1572 [Gonium pectorale]|uniref:Tim44-like domain-containing protein n=1 Tax=Gonium pectorale TaxID=33097 RepID=A0A150H372_GONPE|nr:hypothetical protein GPECTOR_2g1572 [Gonium pectorale]|eukprot:KXZ56020.1 hypothetical protein GPECTOR_2g1572 [Gonium pectorale]
MPPKPSNAAPPPPSSAPPRPSPPPPAVSNSSAASTGQSSSSKGGSTGGATSTGSSSSGSDASTSNGDGAAAEPKAASSSQTGNAVPAGGDPGEPPYVHSHFTGHPELQERQPLREAEWLQRSLGGVGGGGTRWSFLLDGVAAWAWDALRRPLERGLRKTLLSGAAADAHDKTERMVRDCVERHFDGQEFLEGVREAVAVFYEAVGKGDEEALRAMATTKVVEAVKRDRQLLLDEKRLGLSSATVTVQDALLGHANLWGAESVAAFDQEWAASVGPQTTKSWLVLAVYLDVKLSCTYDMPTIPKIKTDEGQTLVPEAFATLHRRGAWLFARGPLPRGVTGTLDSRWKLLAWW